MLKEKYIKNYIKLFAFFLIFIVLTKNTQAEEIKSQTNKKQIYLTNLNHINITHETAKDIKRIKSLLKTKQPKAIYIEQWIIVEPGNKKLLKKLNKLANKTKTKLYLVIGKNTWFGRRGIANALSAYDEYGKYVDGIILRVEPNKVNVWKDDPGIKAQILNLMTDAYAEIYKEAKKRNKSFIAEFPFWFSDFQGPLKSFSQDACDFADKVVFLIDKPEMLDKLEIKWNNITCLYNINITKRATMQTEESIKEIYKKLKDKLTLYSNFNGYIIDSDSILLDNES